MTKKCDICAYEDIGSIDFHDVCVQQCSKCGIIRATLEQYDRLVYNAAYEMNVGGMKQAMHLSDITKKGAKEIERFTTYCSLKSFRPMNRPSSVCNSCRGDANSFFNLYYDRFEILFCPFCNALYFDKSRFDEFMGYAERRCHGFSIMRIIREIFHRGMKDNVEE